MNPHPASSPQACAGTRERAALSYGGYPFAIGGLLLLLAGPLLGLLVARGGGLALVVPIPFTVALGVLALVGLYMLQPREAANLTLFGAYTGTDRAEGLRWANPLARKARLSLRSRNLNVAPLKVNDLRGNPVEIGAVVVWRVRDAAQAAFDVDDYETYVKVQAEAALRRLASMYAYDDGDDLAAGAQTLRGSVDEVAASLRAELQARFDAAGVEVEDAKLSHLAYAAEIAQVMLRRQQAEAIVSARHKIVQGAVGMVEAALNALSEREVVQLDDERKASMVSNLLVVLCADRETQPVVNTGTLYG